MSSVWAEVDIANRDIGEAATFKHSSRNVSAIITHGSGDPNAVIGKLPSHCRSLISSPIFVHVATDVGEVLPQDVVIRHVVVQEGAVQLS